MEPLRILLKSLAAVVATSCAPLLAQTMATKPTIGGFLFVTFKGQQDPMDEQIYFALSKDGRNWTALNDGKPVLVSELGEKGVRDPYLLRAQDGKFYLIATDLSWARDRSVPRSVRAGSRSLVIWESTDLVHWSEPRLVAVAPPTYACTAVAETASGITVERRRCTS